MHCNRCGKEVGTPICGACVLFYLQHVVYYLHKRGELEQKCCRTEYEQEQLCLYGDNVIELLRQLEVNALPQVPSQIGEGRASHSPSLRSVLSRTHTGGQGAEQKGCQVEGRHSCQEGVHTITDEGEQHSRPIE
jgi:hypothetical protein